MSKDKKLGNRSRYPGIKPFSSGEERIFFGRNKIIKKLDNFIQLNQVSILYSKSGLGKSSLLSVGLIPFLKRKSNITPIYIRFNPYLGDDETKITPTYITRKTIVNNEFQETFLDNIIENEPTLWHDVKEQQIINKGIAQNLLLIFDQFEELFNYPPEQINEFQESLAELLYHKVPQRYRDIIEKQQNDGKFKLTPEELDIIYTANNIKVLIGIRSDKMHFLNDLSDYIPTILSNCFELTPLEPSQAEEAIINPALLSNEEFSSRKFDYSIKALNKIIDFLSDKGTKPIESSDLQIICNSIEKKVIRENLPEVSEDNLGDLEDLIKNYYLNQIAAIGNGEDRKKAQKLIEEGLIFEPELRRLSLYEGQINKNYGVSIQLLEELIKVRLIRAETLPDNSTRYEISHDSLVAPILKVKENRQEEEEKQNLKDEATKARRRNYLSYSLLFLALISLGVSIFQYFQLNEKKNQISKANRQIKQFAEKYGKPEIKGKIRELDYDGVLNDIETIQASIQEDTFLIEKILEILYVSNQTGQKSREQRSLTILQNISGYMGNSNSQNIEELISFFSKKYKLDKTHFSNKYFPNESKSILINDTLMVFNDSETTVWQYYIFCKDQGLDISKTGSNWKLYGDYPVVKVDWYEAISYANWLSNKMGYDSVYTISKPNDALTNIQEDTTKNRWKISINKNTNGYRLPKTGEWQVAAGFEQNPIKNFPFISGPNELMKEDTTKENPLSQIEYTLNEFIWYQKNSKVNGVFEPRPVKLKRPNNLGLYDMSGSLWEWCENDAGEYKGIPLKAVVGGAFNYNAKDCTIYSKNEGYIYYYDRSVYNTIGFRLCRQVE